ncbi:unnamed protein product [Prunus armeniaca]
MILTKENREIKANTDTNKNDDKTIAAEIQAQDAKRVQYITGIQQRGNIDLPFHYIPLYCLQWRTHVGTRGVARPLGMPEIRLWTPCATQKTDPLCAHKVLGESLLWVMERKKVMGRERREEEEEEEEERKKGKKQEKRVKIDGDGVAGRLGRKNERKKKENSIYTKT